MEPLLSGVLPGTTVGVRNKDSYESALTSAHLEMQRVSFPSYSMGLWALQSEEKQKQQIE